MSIPACDRDTTVAPITEFVDVRREGDRTFYTHNRSDLSLWAAHCRRHGRDLFEVRRADIESYARQLEADGWLLPR